MCRSLKGGQIPEHVNPLSTTCQKETLIRIKVKKQYTYSYKCSLNFPVHSKCDIQEETQPLLKVFNPQSKHAPGPR